MNREELVEAIARAQWDRMEGRNPQPWPWSSADEAERTEYLSVADAAISVALDAILGPIEALHQSVTTRVYTERDCEVGMCEGHHQISGACYCPSYLLNVCRECRRCYCDDDEQDAPYPCPTRRACDQIRAELGGEG